MKRLNILKPQFVDEMPPVKEHGILYISKKYQIAIHLCACGCGVQSVTPLGPGEWIMNECDGNVSLRPSIGNFSGEKPYHAHYFITGNVVEWC